MGIDPDLHGAAKWKFRTGEALLPYEGAALVVRRETLD
jgi:hypothetical protein